MSTGGCQRAAVLVPERCSPLPAGAPAVQGPASTLVHTCGSAPHETAEEHCACACACVCVYRARRFPPSGVCASAIEFGVGRRTGPCAQAWRLPASSTTALPHPPPPSRHYYTGFYYYPLLPISISRTCRCTALPPPPPHGISFMDEFCTCTYAGRREVGGVNGSVGPTRC